MSTGVLFVMSIVAGLIGAVTGTGGGVVLIPLLTSVGIDIKQAIAMSILSVIAISNSAASQYVRRHVPNLRVSTYLELFAVLGSLGGASLTVMSSRRPLFFLCGGIILVCGVVLWWRQKQSWQPGGDQDALSKQLVFEGSYYDEVEKRTIAYRGHHALLGGSLMLGTGVISGWLGVGSSALTVLVHDLVIGLPPKVSLTTSNLTIGVMALAGACVYLEAGLIDPRLAVPVLLGASLGALMGSKLLLGLTNQVARAVFLGLLLVFGIEMVVHGIMRP